MKVFIGLGNPGSTYDGTRHNIGFAIVDALEQKIENSSGWKAGKGSFYFAKGKCMGEDVVLVKPTTYMNHSGRAVRDVLQFYKASVADVCVITDDIALAVGKLRMRLQGSDGGHNGLTSCILELGTDEFARLRCGVGNDFHRGEQARYVLSKFKEAERDTIGDMIVRAVTTCEDSCKYGFAKAVSKVQV